MIDKRDRAIRGSEQRLSWIFRCFWKVKLTYIMDKVLLVYVDEDTIAASDEKNLFQRGGAERIRECR